MSSPREANLSRLCRSLTVAVQASPRRDPLTDPAVQTLLREISVRGSASSAAQMAAATVLFARDQLNALRAFRAEPPMSLEEMEAIMIDDDSIEADLVRDCFTILRQLRTQPRDTVGLAVAIRKALTAWGPYALVTLVHVQLRLANTLAAAIDGLTTEDVLRRWALSEELLLGELTDVHHHE